MCQSRSENCRGWSQNDQLRKQRIDLEIDRWSNFLDAMSETRLQDEYNKTVRACDVFVSLFFTKTGKLTKYALVEIAGHPRDTFLLARAIGCADLEAICDLVVCGPARAANQLWGREIRIPATPLGTGI